jgi:hypothetical protein
MGGSSEVEKIESKVWLVQWYRQIWLRTVCYCWLSQDCSLSAIYWIILHDGILWHQRRYLMIYTRSSFALIVVNTFNSFFDAGGFVWFSAKEMFAWLLYMRGSHEHRRGLLRIFLLIEVHGIIWSAEYQLVIACIEYAVIRIAFILSTWE